MRDVSHDILHHLNAHPGAFWKAAFERLSESATRLESSLSVLSNATPTTSLVPAEHIDAGADENHSAHDTTDTPFDAVMFSYAEEQVRAGSSPHVCAVRDWQPIHEHELHVKLGCCVQALAVSEDGGYWWCSTSRRQGWLPKHVLTLWRVPATSADWHPKSFWPKHKYLPLGKGELASATPPFQDEGWQGWAQGRLWDSTDPREGFFPLFVTEPVLLIAT